MYGGPQVQAQTNEYQVLPPIQAGPPIQVMPQAQVTYAQPQDGVVNAQPGPASYEGPQVDSALRQEEHRKTREIQTVSAESDELELSGDAPPASNAALSFPAFAYRVPKATRILGFARYSPDMPDEEVQAVVSGMVAHSTS